MQQAAAQITPDSTLRIERGADGAPTVILAGSLNSQTTGLIWREAMQALDQGGQGHVVVDASQVTNGLQEPLSSFDWARR